MQLSSDEAFTIFRDYPKVPKDGRLSFSCVQCGECCKLYANILLKPFDIFRMSGHLSFAPDFFIDKYCEVQQDPQLKLPVVKFRKQTPDLDACPFFIGGKCSIYTAKPASCSLYPLGRITDPVTGGMEYFIQPNECGEKQVAAAPVSLSDWLGHYGIMDDEAITIIWHKWLRDTAGKIAEILSENSNLPIEAKSTFHSFLFASLYLKYDYSSSFAEQFDINLEEIDSIIEILLLSVNIDLARNISSEAENRDVEA